MAYSVLLLLLTKMCFFIFIFLLSVTENNSLPEETTFQLDECVEPWRSKQGNLLQLSTAPFLLIVLFHFEQVEVNLFSAGGICFFFSLKITTLQEKKTKKLTVRVQVSAARKVNGMCRNLLSFYRTMSKITGLARLFGKHWGMNT